MSASHLNLGDFSDLLVPFLIHLAALGEANGGNLVRVGATDLGATLHQLGEAADL